MIKQILLMVVISAMGQTLGAENLVPLVVPAPDATVYEILGVPLGASQREIKRAYLAHTRAYYAGPGANESSHYAKIQEAYAEVSTVRRRASYDYRHKLGPRPADFALDSPASNANARAVIDNSDTYKAALEATLAQDPSLKAALRKWFYLPQDLRTELPLWMGFSKKGAYSAQMLFPLAFLSISSSPGQTALWSAVLALQTIFPSLTVIKNYSSDRPNPRALIQEYVNSLVNGTGPVVSALIAFDLVEPFLVEKKVGRLSAFAGEYGQLRLDRMARFVPALATGQLFRFIQRDAKGLENPWEELFRAEMRSRPKYWLARLHTLQPLLKLSREGIEFVEHAEELNQELESITTPHAIVTRAKLHVKRTCESALQFGAAFFKKSP